VVVSSKFDDVKGLGRHRIVNSILAKEIATEGPVHALSIVAKTPAQWEEGNVVIDKSPSCRGGDGSLPSK
jgi:BolA protein